MGDFILKKLIIIIGMMIILSYLVSAIECQPLMQPAQANNCTITSLWNYGNCVNFHLSVYNITGNLTSNFTYYNLSSSNLCQTLWNITTIGSYTGVVENGDTVSIQIQGDTEMMSFTVIFFMVLFNACFFIAPFVVRQFTNNKPTDYIIKHIIFMVGILFLWLNITILRTMAINAGLGIDDLLIGAWWFITLLVVIVIFAMIYTTLIGYLDMLKQAELRKRMGDED